MFIYIEELQELEWDPIWEKYVFILNSPSFVMTIMYL